MIFITGFTSKPMAGRIGAKNGEMAGTEGLAKRLEAIEIKLVENQRKSNRLRARLPLNLSHRFQHRSRLYPTRARVP